VILVFDLPGTKWNFVFEFTHVLSEGLAGPLPPSTNTQADRAA
jgi:hypothetical protein